MIFNKSIYTYLFYVVISNALQNKTIFLWTLFFGHVHYNMPCVELDACWRCRTGYMFKWEDNVASFLYVTHDMLEISYEFNWDHNVTCV